MSYPKTDIKKSLGWQAGCLILREAYERGQGRRVLSDKEADDIRNSIKSQNDGEVFDNLMDVGRVIELAMLKTNVIFHSTTKLLLKAYFFIHIILTPSLALEGQSYQENKHLFDDYERLRNNHDILWGVVDNSIHNIRLFKCFMVVMADLTRVLSVPAYVNDITTMYEQIKVEVANYNNYLLLLKNFSKMTKTPFQVPPPIKVSQLKAFGEVVKAWRTKIATGVTVGGLGAKWWVKPKEEGLQG